MYLKLSLSLASLGDGMTFEVITSVCIGVMYYGCDVGMSRDDLFNTNASIVRDLVASCAK